MKKIINQIPACLVMFVLNALLFGRADAQCVAAFHQGYNTATGNVDFSQSCSYDTTIHPVIWMWDFGDGATGNGDVVSHHYSSGNSYLVCLVLFVGNGPGCCQDTFCEQIDFNPTTVAIAPQAFSEVSVFAVGKNISVHLTANQQQSLSMKLVTLAGITIPLELRQPVIQGRNEIDFAMNDYPSGIYLLRLDDEKGNFVSKRFVAE